MLVLISDMIIMSNTTVFSALTITVNPTFVLNVIDNTHESDTLVGLVRRREWSVLKMIWSFQR